MGLDRATRKDVKPDPAPSSRAMEADARREALDAGFVGMSAQQLLFDKLDGDLCRSRTLPSTYAGRRERRRLRDPAPSRPGAAGGPGRRTRPQSLISQALGSHRLASAPR